MKWMTAAALVIAGADFIVLAQTPSTEMAPAPIVEHDADVVSIDVSVAASGQSVAGLTAADFQLLDNGVAQRVDSIYRDAMPLDITMLVDVSSHTAGTTMVEVPANHTASMVKNDLAAIHAMLRPQDRIRLLAADTYVKQVFGLRAPTESPAIGPMPMHGLPAVYDALVTAMLRKPETGRRHLVIAWIKALDFISVVDGAAVRDVARRSDAVVHVIQRGLVVNTNVIQDRARVARAWRPHLTSDVAVLTDVAALTGGTFRGLGVLTERGITAAVREIVDDFRTGYVLRYAPDGVARDGWHDVTVRVPARRDATVRVRKGYAGDKPSSTVAEAGAGTRGAGSTPLDQLAHTFVTGGAQAFSHARQDLPDAGELLRDYVGRAPLWPATPRLEAAFVIGLVEAPLLGVINADRNIAFALLRRQHDLVRDALWADEFECAWYRAEMALLQGTHRPADAVAATKQALTRCTHDARLTLGLAVASDRDAVTNRAMGRPGLPDAEVLRLFDTAMAYPQTAAEAGVRSAFVAYRRGDLDDAARRLAVADTHAADGFVRYLWHVAQARVLQKQGQLERAVEQFRAALETWPGAQSARLGLMSALMIGGARAEAETLSEALQTAPEDQFDPLSAYWLGDYRAMPGIHTALRELGR